MFTKITHIGEAAILLCQYMSVVCEPLQALLQLLVTSNFRM